MSDGEWNDSWSGAVPHLEAARRALPEPDERNLGLYAEFRDQSEEGLAFEWLVNAADAQGASRNVWEELHLAAATMGLDDHSYPHAEAFRIVERRLSGE